MVISLLIVVVDTVFSMFRYELLGKSICMLVGKPVARVWYQYSTNPTKEVVTLRLPFLYHTTQRCWWWICRDKSLNLKGVLPKLSIIYLIEDLGIKIVLGTAF